MSEKAPAFQFYPRDFQTDGNVRLMSWASRGVYMDLLCTYWLEHGLPNDMARLAKFVGMPLAKFEKHWKEIAPCFEVRGDDLFQKRLHSQLEKTKAFSDKQSVNGGKGGRPRKINAEENPSLSSEKPKQKPDESQTKALHTASASAPSTASSTVEPGPETPPRTDADEARLELRKALDDMRARTGADGTDQEILDHPQFHSTGGGICRIATCTNPGLMRATAAKVRAFGRPKRGGAPGWDRGIEHDVPDEISWDPRLGPRPDPQPNQLPESSGT